MLPLILIKKNCFKRLTTVFSAFFLISGTAHSAENSSGELEKLTLTTPVAYSEPSEKNWTISPKFNVPFRGFEIQTGAIKTQTQDPLNSISYSPSPSLEGEIFLAYKDLGFTYRHTIAAGSLDSDKGLPASTNEEFRFSLFLDRQLFEASKQRLVGLQTDINIDNSGIKQRIARPDISYSDMRLRWIYGLPVWGAERPNSLANFYTNAEIPRGNDVSVDLLFGTEITQQKIIGSSSFIPLERKATFGAASDLSEVSSAGLGLTGGLGLTALMSGKSYFSIAGLLGGNYNISRAQYGNDIENVSGFGALASARMSVKVIFGAKEDQSLGFKLFLDSWMIPAKESKVASSDAAMSVYYGANF